MGPQHETRAMYHPGPSTITSNRLPKTKEQRTLHAIRCIPCASSQRCPPRSRMSGLLSTVTGTPKFGSNAVAVASIATDSALNGTPLAPTDAASLPHVHIRLARAGSRRVRRSWAGHLAAGCFAKLKMYGAFAARIRLQTRPENSAAHPTTSIDTSRKRFFSSTVMPSKVSPLFEKIPFLL